ncbi:hypothetical protein Dred_1201 [Desulforamulus reducens MI-1]|uniref:Uncharacterized protein n=1 Tax=Desulforamulus reducens (strain ATCC BAA-1160 / DSM 100696 / MI-1) TaxID=349161 RepID=A4J3T2_DESRM|nr:hypothetical protein [Desulforamulus reducens]ABO49735.1 hypothetical protein Dred_1201 [Desulforamulus reducens MI-1]
MGNKKQKEKNFDIAKAAAVEALKDFKEEERQRNKRTRYHNTELLLKNYLSLLDHYENAKERATDIFSIEELDELEAEEVIIQSIKRSRMRTIVMIAQIEHCLEILKGRMASKGQLEKYTVIECLYLDKERRHIERGELIKVVAEELNCGQPSVYRWRNEMIRELSVLLFGVDGLKLDI